MTVRKIHIGVFPNGAQPFTDFETGFSTQQDVFIPAPRLAQATPEPVAPEGRRGDRPAGRATIDIGTSGGMGAAPPEKEAEEPKGPPPPALPEPIAEGKTVGAYRLLGEDDFFAKGRPDSVPEIDFAASRTFADAGALREFLGKSGMLFDPSIDKKRLSDRLAAGKGLNGAEAAALVTHLRQKVRPYAFFKPAANNPASLLKAASSFVENNRAVHQEAAWLNRLVGLDVATVGESPQAIRIGAEAKSWLLARRQMIVRQLYTYYEQVLQLLSENDPQGISENPKIVSAKMILGMLESDEKQARKYFLDSPWGIRLKSTADDMDKIPAAKLSMAARGALNRWFKTMPELAKEKPATPPAPIATTVAAPTPPGPVAAATTPVPAASAAVPKPASPVPAPEPIVSPALKAPPPSSPAPTTAKPMAKPAPIPIAAPGKIPAEPAIAEKDSAPPPARAPAVAEAASPPAPVSRKPVAPRFPSPSATEPSAMEKARVPKLDSVVVLLPDKDAKTVTQKDCRQEESEIEKTSSLKKAAFVCEIAPGQTKKIIFESSPDAANRWRPMHYRMGDTEGDFRTTSDIGVALYPKEGQWRLQAFEEIRKTEEIAADLLIPSDPKPDGKAKLYAVTRRGNEAAFRLCEKNWKDLLFTGVDSIERGNLFECPANGKPMGARLVTPLKSREISPGEKIYSLEKWFWKVPGKDGNVQKVEAKPDRSLAFDRDQDETFSFGDKAEAVQKAADRYFWNAWQLPHVRWIRQKQEGGFDLRSCRLSKEPIQRGEERAQAVCPRGDGTFTVDFKRRVTVEEETEAGFQVAATPWSYAFTDPADVAHADKTVEHFNINILEKEGVFTPFESESDGETQAFLRATGTGLQARFAPTELLWTAGLAFFNGEAFRLTPVSFEGSDLEILEDLRGDHEKSARLSRRPEKRADVLGLAAATALQYHPFTPGHNRFSALFVFGAAYGGGAAGSILFGGKAGIGASLKEIFRIADNHDLSLHLNILEGGYADPVGGHGHAGFLGIGACGVVKGFRACVESMNLRKESPATGNRGTDTVGLDSVRFFLGYDLFRGLNPEMPDFNLQTSNP